MTARQSQHTSASETAHNPACAGQAVGSIRDGDCNHVERLARVSLLCCLGLVSSEARGALPALDVLPEAIVLKQTVGDDAIEQPGRYKLLPRPDSQLPLNDQRGFSRVGCVSTAARDHVVSL
eukprot:296507-Rhodomonas_salina.2